MMKWGGIIINNQKNVNVLDSISAPLLTNNSTIHLWLLSDAQ